MNKVEIWISQGPQEQGHYGTFLITPFRESFYARLLDVVRVVILPGKVAIGDI